MAAAQAYPVWVDASLDAAPSRGLWLFKWILVIPHHTLTSATAGAGTRVGGDLEVMTARDSPGLGLQRWVPAAARYTAHSRQ